MNERQIFCLWNWDIGRAGNGDTTEERAAEAETYPFNWLGGVLCPICPTPVSE